MSGTSNPPKVYNRRKQHSNFAGQTSVNTRISDCYHSVVSSEGNSVTTKDHTASEVVHERKVDNALPQKDLHLKESVRSEKQEHLEICCLNDSCSSSRSNLDLDTGRSKTDVDDLGECSSSGELPVERLRDNISERSISRACASVQGSDVIRDNCLKRSCKICKHPENRSSVTCKDTFLPPCCNSCFKEIPKIDWLCESCMKTKESLRQKSPGRVDDPSPLLGNACKQSTSEDESHGNASGEATSEDGSKEKACAESSSEEGSQENANAESSSEDGFEVTAVRDSRFEQKFEGNASRQAISEGERLENVCAESTSVDDSSDSDTSSEDEMGLITRMLEDKKPFKSNVRIGSQFQADVPEWSGPVIDESRSAGEPLEISVVENLIDTKCKRKLDARMISSIGNWLQCREIVVRAREGVEETVCGKWRRAPLFEVQTDEFECFDCILWDPYHADCSVAQELDTEEVMKQLKYIEMLRPRLPVKRRKFNHCKKVIPQQPTKE